MAITGFLPDERPGRSAPVSSRLLVLPAPIVGTDDSLTRNVQRCCAGGETKTCHQRCRGSWPPGGIGTVYGMERTRAGRGVGARVVRDVTDRPDEAVA
jgi:hypothetical protein